jgi:hypothetical protein
LSAVVAAGRIAVVASTPTPQDRPERGRVPAWLATARTFFWILALGVIAGYLFFMALGAFDPGDVLPLSLAIAALVALWLAHVWIGRRSHAESDPRLRHQRERRGF